MKNMPEDRILCFAYGSNMDIAQMKSRCPSASMVSKATLKKYRFIINGHGVATIVTDSSGIVYGVLWEMTPEDENNLDGYEGVKSGTYNKAFADVETESGVSVKAMIYIAADNSHGYSRGGYMERIVAAARNHELPVNYTEELESWLPTNK